MIPNDLLNNGEYFQILDIDEFEKCLDTESPTSIRLNQKKRFSHGLNNLVPWSKNSFYLETRPKFTLDPYFHAGCYYVQEASSMFLDYILDQLEELSDQATILDLCASPGGKSTILSDFVGNEGCLVANEVIKSRAKILGENILKWSSLNTIVTNSDPEYFGKLRELFDLVLVDAPCSGEGMWRKDKKAIEEWSWKHVNLCSVRQKRILHDAVSSIKPGGYLIYSTCTYNDLENIQNVAWLLKEFDLENVNIRIPEEWKIEKVCSDKAIGFQFLPYQISGEGFFVSVLKKKGALTNSKTVAEKRKSNLSNKEQALLADWIDNTGIESNFIKSPSETCYAGSNRTIDLFQLLKSNVRVVQTGIPIGRFNKNIFIPGHGLALSKIVSEKVPRMNLDKEDALDFLRKKLLKIEHTEKGWVLICYENHGLSWAKNLGNRINNYLPKELAIRNL